MILARTASTSDPVFTGVIIIVIIGLSVLLLWSIIREMKKRKKEREQPKKTPGLMSLSHLTESLNEFVRVYHLSKKATIFVFSFANANELAESFGRRTEMILKDKVLQNVIKILPRNAVLAEYRNESDSYALLLRGDFPEDKLLSFANYLVSVIETPVAVPNLEIEISYSAYLGIVYYPTHAISVTDLLNKADVALYMNQKSPNTKYTVYSSSFAVTEEENLVYYNQIKAAIKNKEFELYYQPICECKTQNIVGFEALIRWKHPELGILNPAKFLSVLENSGDINWIGKWSMHVICAYYNEQRALFKEHNVFFSVNLSVKQLLNENLVNDFAAILNQYHVPTDAICFEIEEYALYERYPVIQTTIRELGEKGFKLAIDHFGLDSNNIKKLESQEPYMIKLVAKDTLEAQDSFVGSRVFEILIDTCKKRNIKISSLMVENQDDIKKLEESGFDYQQGYFIAEPMSAKDNAEFFSASFRLKEEESKKKEE